MHNPSLSLHLLLRKAERLRLKPSTDLRHGDYRRQVGKLLEQIEHLRWTKTITSTSEKRGAPKSRGDAGNNGWVQGWEGVREECSTNIGTSLQRRFNTSHWARDNGTPYLGTFSALAALRLTFSLISRLERWMQKQRNNTQDTPSNGRSFPKNSIPRTTILRLTSKGGGGGGVAAYLDSLRLDPVIRGDDDHHDVR